MPHLILLARAWTLKSMRTSKVELLAAAVALVMGCSSSNDEPGGAGGSSGDNGVGGSLTSAGGTVGQAGTATSSAGTTPMAGTASGGSATGGETTSGAGGRAGADGKAGGSSGGPAHGGASAGSGAGGRANGGTAGSSSAGGSGGSAACVKNLACTLSPPPTTGDIYQDCVDRINQFLTECACLPALERRKDGEACADKMAEYDAVHDSFHAGAQAQICTPGGSQNECPGYSSNTQVIGLCMQQMWDEGPPPTADCSGECYEMHGHFINMTDKNIKKVACGFYTTDKGKVWAVQNFTR